MNRPEVGVVMPGTGGLRKVRFASTKGNKGKTSSERVCYALFPRHVLGVDDGVARQHKFDGRGAVRGQGEPIWGAAQVKKGGGK